MEPVAVFLGGLATVLSRWDEAEAYFEEASELSTRGGMKFALAHTQLLWGSMLVAKGGSDDAHRARGLLEQTRSAAVANGYVGVERKATAALGLANSR